MKGRTALHIAAAYGNKKTVETLLFLNANPLIEDIYGQRPLEMASDDGIRDLLQAKMQRAQAPGEMKPILREKPNKAANETNSILKPRKMSQMSVSSSAKGATAKGVNNQYPLELKDLKTMYKEKIVVSRIGIENDNYLMYAIKNKSLDACLYLLSEF